MVQKTNKLVYSDDENQSIYALSELVRTASLTGEELPGQKKVADLARHAGAEIEWLDVEISALFKAYPDIAQYPTHWEHDLILPYDERPNLKELKDAGLEDVLNYNNRPNLIARWRGTGGGKSLILNGHIDTVTIEPRSDWSTDPFGAEIRDGKLYGRGSVDMKGGVSAAIQAMRILRDCGIRLKGDVLLQSVVNEEHAGNGTLDLVRRGVTADAAIVLEPTQTQVFTSNAGGLYWTIEVPGTVRSPGARWEGSARVGVSAIEVLGPVIEALQQIESNYCDIGGPGAFSLVLGQVSGGHYDTATAGSATLRGTAYFADSVGDLTAVMDRFRALPGLVAQKEPYLAEYPIKVQFLHHDDASVQPETPNIAETVANVLNQNGRNSQVMPGNFVCDLRHLVNRGSIPSIVFGPGNIAQAHKIDEHIEIREYLDFIQLLTEIIPKWCNQGKETNI